MHVKPCAHQLETRLNVCRLHWRLCAEELSTDPLK